MKRCFVALLAAAALSSAALAQPQSQGAATAHELNPHGIGYMLAVPYLNTQGGHVWRDDVDDSHPD